MKNTDLLSRKIEDALAYLYNQEEQLKPCIKILQDILKQKISEEELSARDAFEMYLKIQSQFTNNFLLMAKLKEIIDFKE